MEALEALDAIDRHGSFAAAATALHRVPSAVTYIIKQLETDLGVALFDRGGHRAVLTPAGRLVLDEGRHILTAGHSLAAAARRTADHWEPELRIAVDSLIPPAMLWPAIDAFADIQPATDIRVVEETLGGTLEALTENRVDLAIAGSALPAGPGIRNRVFATVEFAFCCAPSHPLARQPEPVADAMRCRYRAVAVTDSARHLAARTSGLLDNQRRLTVSSMQSKIDALIHGLGVGYCPRSRVAEALADGRLIEKRLAADREPVQTYLYWHHGAHGRALHWFLENL